MTIQASDWLGGFWKLVPWRQNLPVGPHQCLIDPDPSREATIEDRAFKFLNEHAQHRRRIMAAALAHDERASPVLSNPEIHKILSQPHEATVAAMEAQRTRREGL